MIIHENSLTEEIFITLRKHGSFKDYYYEDVKYALKNTLFSVVVFDEYIPVGMGRVVGDGRIAFFIKDVVVHSDYRGQKIGSLIMNNLLNYIKSAGTKDAYVGLMSSLGKEKFYEKFGFITRPNEIYGAGMIMFLKEKGDYE